MTTSLLKKQEQAISALKGKRRALYNKCTLNIGGQLRFCTGAKLQEFWDGYQELLALRDEWAGKIRESYSEDKTAFLQRIRGVLVTMDISVGKTTPNPQALLGLCSNGRIRCE